jgi:hypothetical protein
MLLQGIKLNYEANSIFIYHGHQVSNYLETYNSLSKYLVRYLVNPVGIKNNTVSINSIKKFKTELRAYQYSTYKKIVTIIGHTHRPLFESMSKIDTLNMIIERYLRYLDKVDDTDKERIEHNLSRYVAELRRIKIRNGTYNLRSGLYDEDILLPCLFNSGSVVGKRGMTAIEIKNGKIYLVYWFDSNNSKRYLDYEDVKSKQFGDTDYYKAILKKEKLPYIFNRIKFLS